MKITSRFHGFSFILGFAFGLLLWLLVYLLQPYSVDKVLAGVEPVFFASTESHLLARVDSGATTSSLSAQDIEIVSQDGLDWVYFSISIKGLQQEQPAIDWVRLRQPLVRYAEIRQANNANPVRRPVVLLWVQIQGQWMELEFTLTDRSHLSYPVLLGRNLLENGWLLDVSRPFSNDFQIPRQSALDRH
ncbi:ATP-dependent zinc protease [Thiomicrospira microaerophila]|uniref:ATP-dependent zinc protease family protein n=1 Tax=Thiomicrospira microaerophila TaxID=406020 RepID=UPI0020103225|nr:RimK/LysX family protein [Thiomicrospira microaerophila]UQB41537.1 ATP-dependent zinc protease [Thiomicrospira microaerophila]